MATSPIVHLPLEPTDSARAAGLRYVTDLSPGIQRVQKGKGFRYQLPDGSPLEDEDAFARIRSLAIPPAWTEVWICPHPLGHIQATGRDAKGRKQYRYHPKWREVRDETKYGRLVAFGDTLPKIRARVERDLGKPGLPREKVLAAVVALLESTLVRVGNEEYARENRSYGLTTLRDHHVEIRGTTLRFRFRGKSGKEHRVKLTDARLAKIVKACQDIPGFELFRYIDEQGEAQSIDSADVNAYLREVSGEEFTAKHYRTWAGTVQAARLLRECGAGETKREAKSALLRVIAEVSERLGNTPAVCRKCYVDPLVASSFLAGTLMPALEAIEKKGIPQHRGLTADERLTLTFLRQRFAKRAKPLTARLPRSRSAESRSLDTADPRRRATA